jgi:hypothetical protein
MFAFRPSLNVGAITQRAAYRQDFAESHGKFPPICRFWAPVAFLRQDLKTNVLLLGWICNEGEVRLGYGNLSEKPAEA